ncbi:MAG: hypothetical protein AAGA56_25710, partial [Myxococcota bacterium]
RFGARISGSLADEAGELRVEGIESLLQLFIAGNLIEQHVVGDTLTAESKKRREALLGDDVIVSVPAPKRLRLDFAKNHIVHWFVERAIVSVGMLAPVRETSLDPATTAWSTLSERVRSISSLLKYEFSFRTDTDFSTIFADVIEGMRDGGELALVAGQAEPMLMLGPGREGLDGGGYVRLYAGMLRCFLDGYRVAARGLRVLLKGPLEAKELTGRILKVGERMFLEGDISRSEAVNRPLFENALKAFVDLGYLRRVEGKLALQESFAGEHTIGTVEARVAALIPPLIAAS